MLVERANWLDSASGTALVGGLRAAGRDGDRIPPLIVTTQEGGGYRALADLPPEETQLAIGDAGSFAAAEDWATRTGEALAAAGIDLNLSPVADVATLDSPLADRAFSDDAALAAELTAGAVRGCRAAEIACAALHFPGLGAASQDTSRGRPRSASTRRRSAARDLQAFEAAFAEGVPAVVLSLAFYTSYDPVTPGALAEPVATGLLREELGFEGVAITDDLGGGAVRARSLGRRRGGRGAGRRRRPDPDRLGDRPGRRPRAHPCRARQRRAARGAAARGSGAGARAETGSGAARTCDHPAHDAP